jgi:adenylate cyclase, class 2
MSGWFGVLIIILVVGAIIYWLCSRRCEICGGGIEYEAKFLNVDPDKIRQRLKELGGEQVHPEITIRRYAYSLPDSKIKGFARVRDEGKKTTMTVKTYPTDSKYADETEVSINEDFETGHKFMSALCKRKAYQLTKREKWTLPAKYKCNEVDIDTLPGLEKYIEIECQDEESIKNVSQLLGFEYDEAHFGSFARTYREIYGIPEEYTNDDVRELTFKTVQQILGPKVIKNKKEFESICKKYQDLE